MNIPNPLTAKELTNTVSVKEWLPPKVAKSSHVVVLKVVLV